MDLKLSNGSKLIEHTPESEIIPMETIPNNCSNFSHRYAVKGQRLLFHYGRNKQKQRIILNGVDITVHKGTIYGLLGPSGCGKTTLLKCIIGRLKPKEGSIKLYGRHPGDPGLHIPGRAIGYMPQDLALYPEITINETLNYFGRLYYMENKLLQKRIKFLLSFLEIKKKNSLIKNLSGGEKRRVSFAVALIHEPPLLILDEPTVGVDPLLRHSIWEHLKYLTTKNHMTIIITTHYVEEARRANTVALMRDGHLLAEMHPELLIRKHGVQNLEDVFWKLCKKEKELDLSRDSSHQYTICQKDTSSENVWLRNEEVNDILEKDTSFNSKEEKNGTIDVLSSYDEENAQVSFRKLSRLKEFQWKLIRLLAIITKSAICLKRNTPFALFQTFIPAFQVIVFCLCIGQEPFDLPIAIVNNETNYFGYSSLFLSKLNNHTFKQEFHETLSSALESVKNGKSWGAMYIGPRFTSAIMDRLLEGNNVENETIYASTVRLYFDMTNQQISFTMFARIIDAFQVFAKELLVKMYQNPYLSESPVVLEAPIYGTNEPNFSEFVAPGVILGMTHLMALGLTCLCIIIEKKEGLLDRSWVAGVSTTEIIFGITFILFITMLGQVALVLISTLWIFNIPVHGSVFWVFICTVLAGASGMAYGLVISAICDREIVAVLISLGSFYPIFLLSGLFWPVEGMDYYLRYISRVLPLSFLGDTTRSIMLRGWSITDHYIWIGCLIPIAWTIFLVFAACILFKLRQSK